MAWCFQRNVLMWSHISVSSTLKSGLGKQNSYFSCLESTWDQHWKSFCFNWWDVWYPPYAKPLFPFLFFARIMSTLFILTVPTTRRTTAAHLLPRPCQTEPARCPAAALTPSARGTSAAATTAASTPAWSLCSPHQVLPVRCGREKRVQILVGIPKRHRLPFWSILWVGVKDKTLVPHFWFLGGEFGVTVESRMS